jgi:hypothetical protein
MSRKFLISTTHHRHKPSEFISRSWCLVWNHCRVYNCPSALVMVTVNLESYINLILNRFSTELMQEHRLYVCFQQKLATAHTACNYIAAMLDKFLWHEWRLMGQLIPETSHFVPPFFFLCACVWGGGWEMKCTKKSPCYMNLKEIFMKKYPGFLQQSCYVWIRVCSCDAMYVYENKANIFKVSFESVILA